MMRCSRDPTCVAGRKASLIAYGKQGGHLRKHGAPGLYGVVYEGRHVFGEHAAMGETNGVHMVIGKVVEARRRGWQSSHRSG